MTISLLQADTPDGKTLICLCARMMVRRDAVLKIWRDFYEYDLEKISNSLEFPVKDGPIHYISGVW